MKRIIALCITLSLLLVVRPISATHATGNPQLSSLSDEALLAFLDEYDVEIPLGFKETNAEICEVVRWWVERVESNPNTLFGYNHPTTLNFACAVKNAVNDYYCISPLSGSASTYTRYVLQQSTLWSIPTNAYSFNCYAYALGRSDDDYYPGYFSVGEFEPREIDSITSSQLADRVIADLTQSYSLNKKCAYKTTVRPNYDDLASGQTAICVRKGTDLMGNGDYHFARLFYETEYEYGDAWRHKPKMSYVLQFINYPSHSIPWVAEIYQANGPKLDEDGLTYSGTIYYIIFANNCSYSVVLVNDYHQGNMHYYQYTKTCVNCGKTETYTNSVLCGDPCGEEGLYPNHTIQEGIE